MNSRGVLRRDIAKSLAANGIYAAAQWGVVLLVARYGSPEQVGLISLTTAIATPLFFVCSLSLREAIPVDGAHLGVSAYLTLRDLMTVLAWVGSLLIFAAGYRGYGVGLLAIASTILLTKSVEDYANVLYGFYQRKNYISLVARSTIARAVFGIVGFSACFFSFESVAAGFIGQATMWLCALILMDRRGLRAYAESWNDRIHNSWSNIREVARLVAWLLPLALAGGLHVLAISVPRVVLERYVELDEFGVFSAIAYLQTASVVLSMAIGHAAVSRLARHYEAGRIQEFLRVSGELLLLSACIGGLLIVVSAMFGADLLRFVYGEEYADAELLLVMAMAVSAGLVGAVFQFSLTAGLSFGKRVAVNFSTLAISMSASITFIPSGGALGACWAILCAMSARAVLGAALTGSMVRSRLRAGW